MIVFIEGMNRVEVDEFNDLLQLNFDVLALFERADVEKVGLRKGIGAVGFLPCIIDSEETSVVAFWVSEFPGCELKAVE